MNELLKYIDEKDLTLVYCDLPQKFKGLYNDDAIYMDGHLSCAEERCILAEEIGHYETSSGNILDMSNLSNYKQEIKARTWAVDTLISLNLLIAAYESGVRNRFELAEFLGVTEEFLAFALEQMQYKHGSQAIYGDYIIYFDGSGLGVMKMV